MSTSVVHFQWKAIVILYTTILVLGSLQAIAVFGIPCSWISLSIAIPIAYATLYFFRDTTELTAIKLIGILLIWLFITSALNSFGHSYAVGWTADASTPYWLFVFLRFFSIIAFALFLYSLITLSNQGIANKIITVAVVVGVLASIYAVYSYYAQLYGLPEIRHNRAAAYGSNGEKIIFSYAFHRAMGTFLEPSTLAAFLIVPFFCSMSLRNRMIGNTAAVIILATIFLTGSLTGILSILLGILVTFLFLAAFGRRSIAQFGTILLRLIFVVLLSFLSFKVLVHPYSVNTSYEATSENAAPAAVAAAPVSVNTSYEATSENAAADSGMSFLVTRITRMMKSGLEKTNRGYVYTALKTNPPPVIGTGVGTSYLALGKMLGKNTAVNFLNLYLNMLYSGGIFALLALVVFLAYPIIRVLKKNAVVTRDPLFFYFMSAYIAWLAIYFVLYDEFNLMFAVPYAILITLSKREPENAEDNAAHSPAIRKISF